MSTNPSAPQAQAQSTPYDAEIAERERQMDTSHSEFRHSLSEALMKVAMAQREGYLRAKAEDAGLFLGLLAACEAALAVHDDGVFCTPDCWHWQARAAVRAAKGG